MPVSTPSKDSISFSDMRLDFSVIGNEFVNFISTVATCRIIRKARQCGLLEKISYGDLMDDLSSAWRRTDAPPEPSSDDGYWVHTLKYVFDELEALGLSTPEPKPEPSDHRNTDTLSSDRDPDPIPGRAGRTWNVSVHIF